MWATGATTTSRKDLVDEGVRAGRRVVGPFAYQAISASPSDLQACSAIHAADRHPPRAPLVTGAWTAHKKLRIGYLCGEFREQATSFLTAGMYEEHDKEKFEIVAFDSGWSDNSRMRERLERSFDRFLDISRCSDAEAAKMVMAEEIDILVNLNGYFGENRMGMFARRPAPIQVNYLGFPATLGAPYMDYILADRIVIPENERRFYTEQVVTLPDSYQANDSKRAAGTPARRLEHGLPERKFILLQLQPDLQADPGRLRKLGADSQTGSRQCFVAAGGQSPISPKISGARPRRRALRPSASFLRRRCRRGNIWRGLGLPICFSTPRPITPTPLPATPCGQACRWSRWRARVFPAGSLPAC